MVLLVVNLDSAHNIAKTFQHVFTMSANYQATFQQYLLLKYTIFSLWYSVGIWLYTLLKGKNKCVI